MPKKADTNEAHYLKYIMDERGFTLQRELAEASDVAESTISKIMNGGTVTASTVDHMAESLGIDQATFRRKFYGGEPDADQPTSLMDRMKDRAATTLLYVYDQLSPADREALLAMARTLAEKRQQQQDDDT